MMSSIQITSYILCSLALLFLAWLYVKIYVWVFYNIILPIFGYPIVYFDMKYVQKNREFGNRKNHSAIILANNYWPEKILIYSLEISKLIKTLKLNNESYKVYDKVSQNDFRKIINDNKVSSVYIFGHGQRHGVKLGKNKIIYYCEFQDAKKKTKVYQFHCNHNYGKSLADYVLSKNGMSFVTCKKMSVLKINSVIDKLYKEAKRKDKLKKDK